MPAKRRGRKTEGVVPSGELQAFKSRFFRAISHPSRIRLLEILVRDERTVQELQEALSLKQPIVSQHLAILRSHGIVKTRKHGVSVTYALREPALVGELLEVARRIFSRQLVSTHGLLRELQREAGSSMSSASRHS
jgi:DNA-binding transcriptional ArsR family regulator